MPSTAGTTPAPVRNSVCRSLTSKSGGKALAFLPFNLSEPVLIGYASVLSAAARTVNRGAIRPVSGGRSGFVYRGKPGPKAGREEYRCTGRGRTGLTTPRPVLF